VGGQGGAYTSGGGLTSAGAANTGGGGGGARGQSSSNGFAGGSGVVILRYPSSISCNVGSGLTASTSTVGNDKVTTFTAGTGTITFS
jgi:hypothetical protein